MARRHSAVVLAHLATNIDQTTPSETKIDKTPKFSPYNVEAPAGRYLL